jgi:FAD dependent oxidoreductase TIGR03364
VVGAFHALFAAEAGMRVLLLERDDRPRGASVLNFGMVVPSGVAAGPWHELALASAAIFRDLAARGAVALAGSGTQYVATTAAERDVLEEFAAVGPGYGYACRLLGAAASVAHNPALEPAAVKASLLFPDDVQVDQRALLPRLIAWMVETLGVVWRPGCVVTGVERAGGGGRGGGLVRVRAAHGVEHASVGGERAGPGRVGAEPGEEFRGRRVVVCPGADIRTLFPDVFARAGVGLCRLRMLRTVPQPARSFPFPFPTAVASGWSLRRYDSFALCQSRPALLAAPMPDDLLRHGIHVLLKREPDGAVTIGDSHHYFASDDLPHHAARSDPPAPAAAFEVELNAEAGAKAEAEVDAEAKIEEEIEDAILREARRIVRLPDWRIADRWTGIYPTHPTREALVEHPDDNISVVAILGGKGMTCGPALARCLVTQLADSASGRWSHADWQGTPASLPRRRRRQTRRGTGVGCREVVAWRCNRSAARDNEGVG